jgi:endonuclease/exonuclease/phosphatase family metal-dependent hydrolase
MGKEYRLITTHLDSLAPIDRMGQAVELAQATAESELPVVLIGDFNSDAESSDPDQNGAYQLVRGAGFLDARHTTHRGDSGFTWPLHDEDPFTPFSGPSQRIDVVLYREVEVVDVELIRNRLEDLTPYGLWPSDHAGLAATLQVS